jgi:hypothetical protein
MKKTIELLASKDSPNDVVMVYYKGDEAVQTQGNYFATSVSKFDPDLKRSGITYRGLQECFGETLGAKVLMLDVTRRTDGQRSQDEVAQAKDAATYFGVLRYQWANGNPRASELMADWRTALNEQKVEMLRTATMQLAHLVGQRSGSEQAAFDRHVPTGLANLLVDKKVSP